MNNRARGDYLERQTIAALQAHGWLCIRAGGSRGVADVWALRAGNTPLLVQCKLDGKMGPGERTALIEASRQGGARPIMAARSKRGLVDIYVVRLDTSGPLIDQIRVPTRPGKAGDDDA
jgi:Holliday junction resolvase